MQTPPLAKDLLGIEGEFADACYDLDDEDETEEAQRWR